MKSNDLKNLILEAYAEVLSELNEAPDGLYYIKVPRRDYKRGIEAIERNIDGNFTKIDIVDDDGAGNVIVYFHGEDAGHVVYDAVMDLRSMGIDVVDSTADLFQEVDHNDPVLMKARVAKMRANDMKKLDALKKADKRNAPVRAIIAKLKAKRAEVEREMENDPGIEPEGGPVADKYGDILNKIDNAIEKAATKLVKEDDKETDDYGRPHVDPKGSRTFLEPDEMLPHNRFKDLMSESLLDELSEEEDEEEELQQDPDAQAPPLKDSTDQILQKFPTLQAAIIKLQTEDFKEFVSEIDWISPRPTAFRINLKNGQNYILKWTGTGFEAQIMGKRYYINKISDYQQALDKLAVLYKEAPMKGAGEDMDGEFSDSADTGGGGDFPGDDTAGGGDDLGDDDLGGDDLGGEEGGEDLSDEPIDFEAGEEG